MKKIYLLFFAIFLFSNVKIHTETIILNAGDNLMDNLEKAKPGDTLLLHQGKYVNEDAHINSTKSGTKDKRIVIMGYGNGEERPQIIDSSLSHNMWEIKGSNLTFKYLNFRSFTYAIRLGNTGKSMNEMNSCENITIEDCVFTESGDGDLSANYSYCSYKNIQVLNNYFDGTKATPVYIGNHSGFCPTEYFIFRGNIVDASQAFISGYIGYGMEYKLDVTKSIIENNYFTGSKGPSIISYGSNNMDTLNSNIIRNNIIVNAYESAGINISGGPAVVQNNVIINSSRGIWLQNYGNRNLNDNIVVTNNTVAKYRKFGFNFRNLANFIGGNNVVISNANSNYQDPGPIESDTSYALSSENDNLINQVMQVVPEKEFINNLWSYVSSGPLTPEELNTLLNEILKHSKPIRVVHN